MSWAGYRSPSRSGCSRWPRPVKPQPTMPEVDAWLQPWVISHNGDSFPSQHTEHFGLNLSDLVVSEPRVHDSLDRTTLHIFQKQYIPAICISEDVLEAKSLSPHEK